MIKKEIPSNEDILKATQILVAACHGRAWNAGWFHDPKTGEEIPITARRVVTFHASQKLKGMVEDHHGAARG